MLMYLKFVLSQTTSERKDKLVSSRRTREKKDNNTQISNTVNKAPFFKEHRVKEIEDKQCRVCLEEVKMCIPIFGDDNSTDISEDLATMASIEIDPLDRFPKYLCYSCHSLLQAAVKLRKNAQQSDIALRNTKIKPEISLDYKHEESLDFLDNRDINETEVHSNNEDGSHINKFNIDLKPVTNKLPIKKFKTKYVQCPLCLKQYRKAYINQHMAFHQGIKPYMCDICGKKVSQHGTLNKHRLTHFNNFPYKCTLCPYRGRFHESLKMHMLIHTGEKLYQCSECPSRCSSKSNLTKHMRTHKTERDFKCEKCGRGFYSKSNLEQHFKVDHTGIKDHICNICGKAFGYRKQMRKHQLKVHNQEKQRSGRMPLYLQLEANKNATDDT